MKYRYYCNFLALAIFFSNPLSATQEQLNNKLTQKVIKLCAPLAKVDTRDFIILEKLFKDGANPNIQHRISDGNQEPLFFTPLYAKKFEIIKLFVQYGVDINSTCLNLGSTPLSIAVQTGELNVVKFLIHCGANIESKNNHQETALHNATLYNNQKIAKFLIAAGANIESKDKWQQTPLYNAISHEPNNVQLFIQAGANINIKDSNGQTVLHTAALCNNLETIALLIRAGVNPEIKDNFNMTAHDYCNDDHARMLCLPAKYKNN